MGVGVPWAKKGWELLPKKLGDGETLRIGRAG